MTKHTKNSENENINLNNPLLNLPVEILTLTLSYLSAKDIAIMALVCKKTNVASGNNFLWFSLYNQLPNATLFNSDKDYKTLYRERVSFKSRFYNSLNEFIAKYEDVDKSNAAKSFIALFKLLLESIKYEGRESASLFVAAMSIELERVSQSNGDYSTNLNAAIINTTLYDKPILSLNIRQIDTLSGYVEFLKTIPESTYEKYQLNKQAVVADAISSHQLYEWKYGITENEDNYYYRQFYE